MYVPGFVTFTAREGHHPVRVREGEQDALERGRWSGWLPATGSPATRPTTGLPNWSWTCNVTGAGMARLGNVSAGGRTKASLAALPGVTRMLGRLGPGQPGRRHRDRLGPGPPQGHLEGVRALVGPGERVVGRHAGDRVGGVEVDRSGKVGGHVAERRRTRSPSRRTGCRRRAVVGALSVSRLAAAGLDGHLRPSASAGRPPRRSRSASRPSAGRTRRRRCGPRRRRPRTGSRPAGRLRAVRVVGGELDGPAEPGGQVAERRRTPVTVTSNGAPAVVAAGTSNMQVVGGRRGPPGPRRSGCRTGSSRSRSGSRPS